ncbi:MAG TPA: hypothetical protein VGC06_29790 [Actinomycetes bacterium]
MTILVAWAAVLAAFLCLATGILSAVQTRPKRREVINALRPPRPPADDGVPGPITNQSLSTTMESVAKLASALKDLDRVAQMFTLALGFLAVAAAAAGVDAVANAVK